MKGRQKLLALFLPLFKSEIISKWKVYKIKILKFTLAAGWSINFGGRGSRRGGRAKVESPFPRPRRGQKDQGFQT